MPVASGMRAMRDLLMGGVDAKFAEPVRFLPMDQGEPDASRQTIEFAAVLRVGGGQDMSLGGRSGSSWRSSLAAGKSELHIARQQSPGISVKAGDLVVALDRHGQPMFEVLRVDDRGESRLVLELGEA